MSDKTALITGASSGIGKAFAPLFARDGYDLVIVARREPPLQQLATSLRAEFGVQVHVVAMDLAAAGAADALWHQTQQRGVHVDVLINNAGFGSYGTVLELPLEKQREMMALNITVLTELCHLYGNAMRKRGRGRILNVASTAAYQPGPRMAVYYASKAYVLSLSEAMSAELEGTGITVTALCPGPTASEFMDVAQYVAPPAMSLAIMSSEDVAAIGYKALMHGERVAVTGMKNKLMTVASQLGPRGLVLKVTESLIKSRGD